MTAESPIVIATQTRAAVAEAGRKKVDFEITIPESVAALIIGVPKTSLNLPILVIPLDKQVKISVCSDNRQLALKALSAWSETENSELKSGFLERQYLVMYQFAQRGFTGTAASHLAGEAGLFLDVLREESEIWESILDHATQTGKIEETDLKTVGEKMSDLWQQLPPEIRNSNSSFAPENALSSIVGS